MIDRDGELTYETVRELLDESELADVVIYETSGRRVDSSVEAPFELQVLTRLDDNEFEIRCKASMAGKGGQYVADAGAVFKFQTECKIEEGIAREFAEKVGVDGRVSVSPCRCEPVSGVTRPRSPGTAAATGGRDKADGRRVLR
jgi:hypothetical protein